MKDKRYRLYMMVTEDKYELPRFVSENIEEVAEFAGVSVQTVRSCAWRQETGKSKRSRFISVHYDD